VGFVIFVLGVVLFYLIGIFKTKKNIHTFTCGYFLGEVCCIFYWWCL